MKQSVYKLTVCTVRLPGAELYATYHDFSEPTYTAPADARFTGLLSSSCRSVGWLAGSMAA